MIQLIIELGEILCIENTLVLINFALYLKNLGKDF